MSDTAYIEQCLRERYRLPQWALFFEVPNAIGILTRRADAVAVSLDVHRRGQIIGFEIKASRNDWLRELKEPKKAASFAKRCHEFYIVAGADVVEKSEIPEPYGWIDPFSRGRKKKAVFNYAPKIDLDFMCILLRRAALTCEKYEAIRRVITSTAYDTRMFETNEREEER